MYLFLLSFKSLQDQYGEFIAAYGPPYQQNLIDYVSQKLDFKVEEQ